MMINQSTMSTGSSRFSNPVPLPSVPSPFISQPNGGRSSVCEFQSAAFIDPVDENRDISWGQESLQELLDFPIMESIQTVQMDNNNTTVALASGDNVRRSDWSDWDPLVSIGDGLDQYWPDLPVSGNNNGVDSKSEVIEQSIIAPVQHPQNYQHHQLVQSVEHSVVPDPSSAAQPTKSRMRWTQELHEAFTESVAKLGGSERATPKCILTLMKVPSLTIYHVKSHLQKYRSARFKPELSEAGSSGKQLIPGEKEVKSKEIRTSMGITEALRLQVELQKRLHEQLETQRKLQLQIEEQGKYLQKMVEKTMGNKLKASSSSNSEEPSLLVSNPENVRTEDLKQESEKHEKHEKPELGNVGTDSPAMKRARIG